MERRGFTITEFIVVIGILVVLAAVLLPALTRSDRGGRRPSCANNLKQIGLSLKMYANESRGEFYPRAGFYYESPVDCDTAGYPLVYPLLGKREAVYTNFLYMPSVYPEYLPDPSVLICLTKTTVDREMWTNPVTGEMDAARPCAQEGQGVTLADSSYTYLNYVFDSADEKSAKVESKDVGVLSELFAAKDLGEKLPVQLALYANILYDLKNTNPEKLVGILDGDIDLEASLPPSDFESVSSGEFVGNSDTNTLYRIREGVERFLHTDITKPVPDVVRQSTIPIMFDTVGTVPAAFNHIPGGSYVLYMDGHVSFVKFGPEGKFPVNRPMGALMEAMRGHPTFMKK